MEKDFHFAVTYTVARLAGIAHGPAETVARAAQYVDDTVSEGTIRFRTGEHYRRLSSAHEKLNPKIVIPAAERQVWLPFHFLPGNDQGGFYDAIVCRPNSPVAQAMLARCIAGRDSPHAWHRLGVTAHVFVDTWAHQGFSGIRHRVNRVRRIELVQGNRWKSSLAHLRRSVRAQGVPSFLSRLAYTLVAYLLNRLFPMGHGAAFHYPDWPFLEWSYTNGRGVRVERDNPTDFLAAAEELCRFFRRYRLGDAEAAAEGLPPADRAKIDEMLRTIDDPDGDVRCQRWIAAIGEGAFSFGPAKISYTAKGPGSWKFQALGTARNTDHVWERFDFTPAFLGSDWKLFHDAAQAHQFEVLHTILPAFGLCVD